MKVGAGCVAYMTEPGVLELREYDLPSRAEGQLLLEIVAAGICGSEVHMFAGRHPLRALPLGHEFVGRVTEASPRPVDSSGAAIADGDLVTATYFETCLRCPECTRGDLNLCRNGYAKMTSDTEVPPHFFGGLATHYVVSPRQWLYRIPDNVSPIVAASANCALAQAICGMERGAVRAGEHIVIQGAGGLGLYATAVAKERGAHVTVVDAVPGRLATADRFGADRVISMVDHPTAEARRKIVMAVTEGLGADAVFDFAGVPAAVSEGIRLARSGGRYVEIGSVLPGVSVELDLGYMTRSQISLVPVIRYLPRHLLEALAFLARNVDRLPLDELIDGRYTLDRVRDALDDALERRVNRAAIIAFDD